MSRTETIVSETRQVRVKQEGLGSPWFNNNLAVGEAICEYSSSGLVTVTFGPLEIPSTLGTPITLQIVGLPEMKFSESNVYPVTPTQTWLCVEMCAIVNGIVTEIAHLTKQFQNDLRHILSVQLYNGTIGTNFTANSHIHIPVHTFTYRWANLPQ